MSKPRLDAEIPRLLADRYQLNDNLADGAMASVWRGHDQVLGRDVAVKLLHADLAADPKVATQFRQEAVAAANLNHPGIVGVFDTGEHEGIPYIVMELVEGRTVREILREEGPLAPGYAARIAADVAVALDYAHRAGVVHRDVKPANILLTPTGEVKVADFSIAKAAGAENVTRTGEMLGTAGYLAPEQVSGDDIDGRTDVYSLGVCLYEMLTGRAPFKADSVLQTAMAHLQAEVLPPRAVRAGVPREFDAIVLRALAKDPGRRYPSAQAMASALSGLAEQDDRDKTIAVPRAQQPRRIAGAAVPAILPARKAAEGGGFLRHEGRWLGMTLAVVALLVVAGFVLIRADVLPVEVPGVSPPDDTNAPAVTSQVTAQAVSAFDPGGDGVENDDRAVRATDGDTATTWRTETYASPNFGRLKSGLGLVLDAGRPVSPRELTLDLAAGGGRAEVLAANERPAKLSGWEEVAGSETLDRQTTFALRSETPMRYYLVWFTELSQRPKGFGIEVQEVKLRS